MCTFNYKYFDSDKRQLRISVTSSTHKHLELCLDFKRYFCDDGKKFYDIFLLEVMFPVAKLVF